MKRLCTILLRVEKLFIIHARYYGTIVCIIVLYKNTTHSLGACRIIHLLRTCSISVCTTPAEDFHKLVYEAHSDLIGTSLDECHVTLSSLPLKMGGIGIGDPYNALGPAGIASRIKAEVANVVQLPYRILDEEFGLFFGFSST